MLYEFTVMEIHKAYKVLHLNENELIKFHSPHINKNNTV